MKTIGFRGTQHFQDLIVAIIDIYRPYTQWLDDVKHGDMTNDPWYHLSMS